MKKDFLGNELSVGDKVVFMKLKYRDFEVEYIVSMADKSCKIEHEKDNLSRTECRQFYSQIIKVDEGEEVGIIL